METPTAPDPLLRPKFARFLWERGLTGANVAAVLGCTPESIRRYCLPFDHADRQLPGRAIMERIVAYTEGAVTAADFYPLHLNGQADERSDDTEVLRAARAL